MNTDQHTEDNAETTKRHRPWWHWAILVVVCVMLLQWLTLVFASESKSATLPVTVGRVLTDPAQVTASSNPADINATLDASPTQPMIDKMYAVGNPTEVVINGSSLDALDPLTLAPTTALITGTSARGCHGSVTRTVKVYIFVSVVLAWRQAVQTQWCWDPYRVTYRGNSYGYSFHRGSYCWQGQSFSNIGIAYGSQPGYVLTYRLSNRGTLYSSLPQCGVNPFTRTLDARIYYSRGGGYHF